MNCVQTELTDRPGSRAANVSFGGKDHQTLFITVNEDYDVHQRGECSEINRFLFVSATVREFCFYSAMRA